MWPALTPPSVERVQMCKRPSPSLDVALPDMTGQRVVRRRGLLIGPRLNLRGAYLIGADLGGKASFVAWTSPARTSGARGLSARISAARSCSGTSAARGLAHGGPRRRGPHRSRRPPRCVLHRSGPHQREVTRRCASSGRLERSHQLWRTGASRRPWTCRNELGQFSPVPIGVVASLTLRPFGSLAGPPLSGHALDPSWGGSGAPP